MIKRKLIKFGASWCAPCKSASNFLKQFDSNLVQEVDILDEEALAKEYGVEKNIPTFVLVNANGDEIDRFHGYQPAKIKEAISKIS